MKQTLYQRLENEIQEMQARCKLLEKNIESYIASNMLMDAATTKIKLSTLQMVLDNLEPLLTR